MTYESAPRHIQVQQRDRRVMPSVEAPLVVTKNLGKRYGDFVALHPLDVKVSSGEFFGVFGPNGAGKSTFIKLLTGQLKPSIGGVEVLGINAANDPQKLKANIGIVPESESPPDILTPPTITPIRRPLAGS